MNADQGIDDLAVDRIEEKMTTQQPGYAATEEVVRDLAAERRMGVYLIYRFMWSILAFLEILMAFRFVLRMIGANPDSGFAVLMYGITGILVAPFFGLVPALFSGGLILEVTTLIAMVVYAMIFWGIACVIRLVTSLPSARSFRRTTHELTQGNDGNVYKTYTTISNRR